MILKECARSGKELLCLGRGRFFNDSVRDLQEAVQCGCIRFLDDHGVDECAKVMDHVAFQRKLAFPHQVTLFFDKYLLVDRQLVPDVKEARAHYGPIETSTFFKRHPDAIRKTSRRIEAISLGRTDGPG